MKVTRIAHGLILAANEPGYVRSPGLHMSDLYNSLFKEVSPKRYNKKDAEGNESPMDVTVMEEGMAYEGWLAPQLRRRLFGERPGEFFTRHARTCSLHGSPVKDGTIICACGAGVAYSPDWLFTEDELELGEFKRTKYSLRDAPFSEKFDKWICQMKAYCYHLETLLAKLFVLFVNGDYSYTSPEGDEQIVRWDFEFTQVELDRNWARLVNHGKKKGMIPI